MDREATPAIVSFQLIKKSFSAVKCGLQAALLAPQPTAATAPEVADAEEEIAVDFEADEPDEPTPPPKEEAKVPVRSLPPAASSAMALSSSTPIKVNFFHMAWGGIAMKVIVQSQ